MVQFPATADVSFWFFLLLEHAGSFHAEADAEERAKALNMMRMLANRQNSRWLEAKEWDMPYTFDATKFPTLLGMPPHKSALCGGSSYQPPLVPATVTQCLGR